MQHTTRGPSIAYQIFILALCIFALISLSAQAAINLDPRNMEILDTSDDIVCGLFFVDFCVCLYYAPRRWRYLYTWGWLDLISCIPVWNALRWGRLARIQRVIRVLRSFRAARVLAREIMAQRSESTFLGASLVAMVIIVVASITVLQAEKTPDANIRSSGDAVWWAFVTLTTVGYGDCYPITPAGRTVGVVLMTCGMGLFGIFSGFIAAWLVGGESAKGESEIKALRREISELRSTILARRGDGHTGQV